MNEPPTLVLVDARRESDTDVSVVVEVDGRQERALFRRSGGDEEIQILSAVGKGLWELAELWRYENHVNRRLMGIVCRVVDGEKVELPVVLYGR